MQKPDFLVENHGSSIFLLRPVSDTARAWVDEHIGSDNGYQPLYPSILIGHQFIFDVVSGAIRDGLVCR
jgi:hypothetical protein